MEEEKIDVLLNTLVYYEKNNLKQLKKYFIIHSINIQDDYKVKKNKDTVRYKEENLPYYEFWCNFQKAYQNNPQQIELLLPGLELIDYNLKILKQLCNPVFHELFNRSFNKDEIMELLRAGSFHEDTHFQPLIKLLSSICAPVRDHKITNLRQILTNNSIDHIEILRKLYNIIICMIMDMTNFNLDSIKNYMLRFPDNTLEVDLFLDNYDHDIHHLKKTIRYINDFKDKMHYQQISSNSKETYTTTQSIEMCVKQIFLKIINNPVISKCPETWYVDFDMIEHVYLKLKSLYYFMGIKSLAVKYSKECPYHVDELIEIFKEKYGYSLQLSTKPLSIEEASLQCTHIVKKFREKIPNHEILVNTFKTCEKPDNPITNIFRKRIIELIKYLLNEQQLPASLDITHPYSEYVGGIFSLILNMYKHHMYIFQKIYQEIYDESVV